MTMRLPWVKSKDLERPIICPHGKKIGVVGVVNSPNVPTQFRNSNTFLVARCAACDREAERELIRMIRAEHNLDPDVDIAVIEMDHHRLFTAGK